MKKEYCKPFSKVAVFPNEEIIATSDIDKVNDPGNAVNSCGIDAKERQSIDFSDEESIW